MNSDKMLAYHYGGTLMLLSKKDGKQDAKTVRFSHFCGCAICCGKPNTKTAIGTQPVVGRTIAAPRNIPLRSKVRVSIPGLLTNVFTVETRTNRKIDGWDIFRKTHRECVDLGIQWGQIEILR